MRVRFVFALAQPHDKQRFMERHPFHYFRGNARKLDRMAGIVFFKLNHPPILDPAHRHHVTGVPSKVLTTERQDCAFFGIKHFIDRATCRSHVQSQKSGRPILATAGSSASHQIRRADSLALGIGEASVKSRASIVAINSTPSCPLRREHLLMVCCDSGAPAFTKENAQRRE